MDISLATRAAFNRLRISLDQKYSGIIDECARAMKIVVPWNRVNTLVHAKDNVVIVSSYSKHWPCLFPQHGAGRKHERSIILTTWQDQIVDEHPKKLLRGLIHSDGARHLNRVGGVDYPRYLFSNMSEDIKQIFCDACVRLGINWRKMNHKTISIARASDVAAMDSFIGPKS